MQSPNFTALVAPTEKVTRIIWLAFNAVTIGYVVLVYMMFGRSRSATGIMPASPYTIPLVVVALVTALVSRRIFALALPQRRLREIVAREPDPESLARNQQTRKIDPDRLQKIRSLSTHEQRLLAAGFAFFAPFVVQMAFNESIALYGLVLSFLTQSFPPVLPFAAVTLALNLTVSPKLGPHLERIKNLPFQSSSTGAA